MVVPPRSDYVILAVSNILDDEWSGQYLSLAYAICQYHVILLLDTSKSNVQDFWRFGLRRSVSRKYEDCNPKLPHSQHRNMPSVPPISQAWQIHPQSLSHKEYDVNVLTNLLLKDVQTPQPGPGEVLVRMHAASLNFRDLLVIADSPNYPVRTTAGLVPCSDGAGEVAAVGAGGSQWAIGDKVVLTQAQGWLDGGQEQFNITAALGGGNMQGTLSQYRVVKGEWLVAMPKNLSFEEAASLPTAGGTAVHALFSSGITKEGSLDLTGKTVLVQGTGGVSIFAVQLASAAGARVIATSSTAEKLVMARKLGASEVVNYRSTPEWAEEVLKLTDGKGVDIVVEVGGAGTIQQSLKATRFTGTVAIIGILTPSEKTDLVQDILYGAKTGEHLVMISLESADQIQ
jgi:NADPH:quinone reductase-like Zn-dependent oxidoreductase